MKTGLNTRRSLTAVAFGASLVGLVLLSGCVSVSRGDQMQAEITKLKQNQQTLMQDRERLSEMLGRSTEQIANLESVIKEARDLLSRNNADLGAEMIEVRKAIDVLSGKVETQRRDFDKLVKEFDLFTRDVDSRLGSGAAIDKNLPEDKDALWAEADQRFGGGNWAGARSAYNKFLQDHKTDKRADNAQYLIGETFLKEGRYADAILEFRKVLENFKRSDVEDAAVFRSAAAFASLGQCDNAKALYESFLAEYPRSKYRKDATQQVASIKKSGSCK